MKNQLFYASNALLLCFASFMLYYLLVEDSFFHLSISEMISFANHCTKHWHVVVICILPIYIGLIIFGAATFFVYLQQSLCPVFFQYLKRCLHIVRK